MDNIFYKLTQPNGEDFSGSVNFRSCVGLVVRCPENYIIASRDPEDALIEAQIPFSVYKISGTPVSEDETGIAKFQEFTILEECNKEDVFKWEWKDLLYSRSPLTYQYKRITDEDIRLLKKWIKIIRKVDNEIYSDKIKYYVRDIIYNWVWNKCYEYSVVMVKSALPYQLEPYSSKNYYLRSSINNVVLAFIGYILSPSVHEWENDNYPFMSIIKLWKRGLLPAYDGHRWRLFAGEYGRRAKIVYEM